MNTTTTMTMIVPIPMYMTHPPQLAIFPPATLRALPASCVFSQAGAVMPGNKRPEQGQSPEPITPWGLVPASGRGQAEGV